MYGSTGAHYTYNALDGQDGGNDYYRGVAWYRKHHLLASEAAGKKVYLEFDGANIVCDVFVNGSAIGQACDAVIQGTDALGARVCTADCDVRRCAVSEQAIRDFDLAVRTPTGRRPSARRLARRYRPIPNTTFGR